MNIASYKVALSTLLVSTVISVASAAQAQPTQTIEQALQARLSTSMRMPKPMLGQRAPEGIARVSFTVGADGRTHDVMISKRSGSQMIDREAVRMITAFHDLPPGVLGDKLYAVLQYRIASWGDDTGRVALADQVALAHTNASTLRLASLAPSVRTAAFVAPSGSLPVVALAAVPKVDFSDAVALRQ
jgi:TonB family protein